MPGTNPQLTPLAARKQLLLVESEVNRAQLFSECISLKDQAAGWTHRAHLAVDSFASAVSVGREALSMMRGLLAGHADDKPSMLSTVIRCVRLGSSLWSILREWIPGRTDRRHNQDK